LTLSQLIGYTLCKSCSCVTSQPIYG